MVVGLVVVTMAAVAVVATVVVVVMVVMVVAMVVVVVVVAVVVVVVAVAARMDSAVLATVMHFLVHMVMLENLAHEQKAIIRRKENTDL